MPVPSNLKYTDQHEWVLVDGSTATVGITAFAADALGDVVYVEPPQVGVTVTAGKVCGEIESTKSVSDLFSPVSGTVAEVNDDIADDTSVVNLDPYEKGWLFRVSFETLPDLLSPQQYTDLIEG